MKKIIFLTGALFQVEIFSSGWTDDSWLDGFQPIPGINTSFIHISASVDNKEAYVDNKDVFTLATILDSELSDPVFSAIVDAAIKNSLPKLPGLQNKKR